MRIPQWFSRYITGNHNNGNYETIDFSFCEISIYYGNIAYRGSSADLLIMYVMILCLILKHDDVIPWEYRRDRGNQDTLCLIDQFWSYRKLNKISTWLMFRTGRSNKAASWWARRRLKSPTLRLLTQSFIQTQIKENIKARCHWPLWGEFTGDRWMPRTKGQ